MTPVLCGLLLMSLLGGLSRAGSDETMLKVFPASTYSAEERGTHDVSFSFTPSEGPWAEGLDERNVFQMRMRHESVPERSYELRVGVGGQIYSLSGAFGESVPPSWRGGEKISPWNDEVWQFVSVSTRYNYHGSKIPSWLKQAAGPYSTSFFVHQSGCYIPRDEQGMNTLYGPKLATAYDQQTRSYRQLNWGLVPQHKTIHRSPLLYYLQVRDAGGGVIELTWVVHNFSLDRSLVFDHLNAPWGGTRVSSLPEHYVSQPDGSLEPYGRTSRKYHGGVDVRETGGFDLAAASGSPDSPALALVFGRDRHREAQRAKEENAFQYGHSLYRSWRAGQPHYRHGRRWDDWRTRPENSFRNYQVSVVIPRVRIEPGSTFFYRSYLVVNDKRNARKRAGKLVDQVDYGMLRFRAGQTPLVSVSAGDGSQSFGLFARPVEGTLPVFRLRHKPSGTTVLTTDPYFFTPQEKLSIPVPDDHADHDYLSRARGYTLNKETEYLGLAGYGYRERPEEPGWVKLSSVTPSRAEPPSARHHVDVWVAEEIK